MQNNVSNRMNSKTENFIQIQKIFISFSRRHVPNNGYMFVWGMIYAFQSKTDRLSKSVINDVYLTIELNIGSSIQFRMISITNTEHM